MARPKKTAPTRVARKPDKPLGKHAFLNTRIPTRESLINLVVYGYISGTVPKNIPKLYGKALGISLFRNAKTQPSRTGKNYGGNSVSRHRKKLLKDIVKPKEMSPSGVNFAKLT